MTCIGAGVAAVGAAAFGASVALSSGMGVKSAVQFGGGAIKSALSRTAGSAATAAPKPKIPSPGKGCHSFDPATPVLLANGTSRPIGEIQLGDEVLAHDPETGVTASKAVEQLHLNQDTELTDLTVQTADRGEVVLKTTQNHPFWSRDRAAWVEAKDLQPAEKLLSDEDTTVVVGTVNYLGSRPMRDLTVADIHTYYVIAGSSPVLVHNCSGKATVRWDVDMEHATIKVEGGGRSLETEQVILGSNGVGGLNGLPTTGARAEPLGPNVIERTFDVPNAGAAMRAQQGSIGADLGGYDGIHNSCVTYCVSILRAGGVDIPAGARGMIALKKTLG